MVLEYRWSLNTGGHKSRFHCTHTLPSHNLTCAHTHARTCTHTHINLSDSQDHFTPPMTHLRSPQLVYVRSWLSPTHVCGEWLVYSVSTKRTTWKGERDVSYTPLQLRSTFQLYTFLTTECENMPRAKGNNAGIGSFFIS